MEKIVLQNISHFYGENQVLDNIEIEIKQGEFFTLLGPSGCGKTTLLRILAGFISPTKGKILIDGQDITALPPEKRGMGVVFQNYALFPNMTVEENIAYGLKVRRLPKNEIEQRCAYYLDLTGLTEYRQRKTDSLSGGQQQRVAIARALIVEPKMLLLDEPLSNLDVALRVKMRQELRDIQKKTGITTLFITHDQQEALGISHRIAVMDKGVVQQQGTPDEIYNHPQNDFTAQFVGVSNKISGEDAGKLGINPAACRYIRPEQLCLFQDGEGLPVTIKEVQFEGAFYQYTVESRTGSYQVTAVNHGEKMAFPQGTKAYLRLAPR